MAERMVESKMKKRVVLLFMLLLLSLALLACAPEGTQQNGDDLLDDQQTSEEDGEVADEITVVDHNGNTVTLPKEINRIVVADIYPLPSVITVMLGSAEKLVGIHPVSMSAAENGLLSDLYPEILNADTSFMQGSDLNVEELLLLKPDVVFYSAENTQLGQNLTNAGFAAVAVSASKWDYDILETYRQWIALLSQIFPNNDISDKVDQYSQETYDLVQQRTADIEDRKEILFLFKYDETQIVTSGKHFFGQFWCDAVGGVNVAEEITVDNDNAVINMEQIYAWNPEVIFITNFTPTQPEDLYQNAIGTDDWQNIQAVQDKQVYKLPLGIYRSYTPGVDTPITLLWMAKAVYPDLFEDIDIEQEVADYYQELYGIQLTDEQIGQMFTPTGDAAMGF